MSITSLHTREQSFLNRNNQIRSEPDRLRQQRLTHAGRIACIDNQLMDYWELENRVTFGDKLWLALLNHAKLRHAKTQMKRARGVDCIDKHLREFLERENRVTLGDRLWMVLLDLAKLQHEKKQNEKQRLAKKQHAKKQLKRERRVTRIDNNLMKLWERESRSAFCDKLWMAVLDHAEQQHAKKQLKRACGITCIDKHLMEFLERVNRVTLSDKLWTILLDRAKRVTRIHQNY